MCGAVRDIPSGTHLVLSSRKNIMDHFSFELLMEDILTGSLTMTETRLVELYVTEESPWKSSPSFRR
jgi:hypothetical protein